MNDFRLKSIGVEMRLDIEPFFLTVNTLIIIYVIYIIKIIKFE